MKNKLILQRKDGTTREVFWGATPPEWHEPILFDIDLDGDGGKPDYDASNSTLGKKLFLLCGIEKRGFWFFKRKIAYYEEQ